MRLSVRLRDARTFDSLRRHRNYRLYTIGQGVSLTGTWLQNAAQAWLVLQLSHSAAALGVLGFWTFGPYVALGIFGGVISDRFDRRLALIGTQSASLILAAALAALTWTGSITVWQLDLFAGLGGLVQVVDSPARISFVSQMVGRKDLPNAVALNSALFNVTRIVGPAIAGALLAAGGARLCFGLNALSFVAVVVALVAMRPAELFPATRPEKRASTLRDLAEGFQFAWGMPAVRMTLLLIFFISMMSINFAILLPVLAAQTLRSGAQVYGILTSVFGVGALIGALLAATWARASWPLLLACAGGFGVSLLLLAPLRSLPAVILTLIIMGVVVTIYLAASNTLVQLTTPGHLQGRVMGLYAYLFMGSALPGALLTGWLSQAGGTTLAFIVAGVSALLMAGVGLAWYLSSRQRISVSDTQQGAPGML